GDSDPSTPDQSSTPLQFTIEHDSVSLAPVGAAIVDDDGAAVSGSTSGTLSATAVNGTANFSIAAGTLGAGLSVDPGSTANDIIIDYNGNRIGDLSLNSTTGAYVFSVDKANAEFLTSDQVLHFNATAFLSGDSDPGTPDQATTALQFTIQHDS